MRQRPATTIATLSVVLLLATACGQARAGTAIPRGDDAASYVSAKFENAMNKIHDTLGTERDITSSSDSYFRIDDKWLHGVVTSARFGSPESRVSRNHSQKNPDESIDDFMPADAAVRYLHLGPVYKSLAPTPWVSMPRPEAGSGLSCAWAGIVQACHMADAVAYTVNEDKKAIKSARSLPGGKVELIADVTLQNFLKGRVEILPDSVLSQLTDAIGQGIVPTTVTIEPGGTLSQISMEAKISKEGHTIELRCDFHFTGKATAQDFPKTPDAAEVTALPDKAAVDDFYRRLGDLQRG